MKKIKIVIVVSHGFHARILLHSKIFYYLKKNAEITIITPNANEPEFINKFSDCGIKLVQLNDQYTKFEKLFESIRKLCFTNPKLLQTLNIKNEQLKRNNSIKYKITRILNLSIGHIKPLRRLWLNIESLLFQDRKHTWIFTTFKPDGLITVTPGIFPADARLIRTAKKKNVNTFCIVQSWDNLTSKGFMGARPDYLVVWNKIMKNEAIEYHDYLEKEVFIAGVPHFDVYASRKNYESRESVFNRFGLDINKALIFFGTTASIHYPHNLEIIEILINFLKSNQYIKESQILVRLHPEVVSGSYKEDLEKYMQFKEWITFDIPGSRSVNLACDMYEEDTRHLGELLLHSAVTINTASTLSIDACCHNRPVVNIGFDGYSEKSYEDSALRFYDYTHYINIVKAGGVRIAKTREDLIHWINQYLINPLLDSEGRIRVVKEQCYKLDGNSGKRAAEYILSKMKKSEYPK